MTREAFAAFWNRFLASEQRDDVPEEPYDTTQFGDTPALADKLGHLIIAGKKTATCSALWEYEADEGIRFRFQENAP